MSLLWCDLNVIFLCRIYSLAITYISICRVCGGSYSIKWFTIMLTWLVWYFGTILMTQLIGLIRIWFWWHRHEWMSAFNWIYLCGPILQFWFLDTNVFEVDFSWLFWLSSFTVVIRYDSCLFFGFFVRCVCECGGRLVCLLVSRVRIYTILTAHYLGFFLFPIFIVSMVSLIIL